MNNEQQGLAVYNGQPHGSEGDQYTITAALHPSR